MGRVLRDYWMPVLLSSELEADGAPVRVRLVGEELIAFRETSGAVGLIDAFCPHRRAPLYFGRNEEDGLRCVYHGWKFDRSGACVDMPSEPADSLFRTKVGVNAYPTRERNGVVWAYLGTRAPLPELPAVEWNLVPEAQRHVTKRLQYNNWAQSVEGGIDPAHSGFLHAPLQRDPNAARDNLYRGTLNPTFHLLETAYGLRIGTRRPTADAHVDFFSVTHFLMPFYNMFNFLSGRSDPSAGGFAWVPMDDVTTMVWTITWNPLRPLSAEEIEEGESQRRLGGGLHLKPHEYVPPTTEPGGAFRPAARRANDYFVDRAAQRTKRFIGVPGLSLADVAVQEGMGPICQREFEHLGVSDTAIIAARRHWLRAAKDAATNDAIPLGSDAPESYRVRPTGVMVPKAAAWEQAANDWIRAIPGAQAPVFVR